MSNNEAWVDWWSGLVEAEKEHAAHVKQDATKRRNPDDDVVVHYLKKMGCPDFEVPQNPEIPISFYAAGRLFNIERPLGASYLIIHLAHNPLGKANDGQVVDPGDPYHLVFAVNTILEREQQRQKEENERWEKKAEIEAFNAARHPYVTYEYLEEKDFTNVIEMGKLGFRVISTYLVRGASEKEPRWLMERCSNNIQHKNPDGEETLPF